MISLRIRITKRKHQNKEYRLKFSLYLLVLIAARCLGQASTPGSAETTGVCSPAVTGSKNTFTITCGIDKEQGQKILAILNTIIARQLNPDAVMVKLDEIGQDVKKLRRGVYSGYDFNGVKRDERPGAVTTTVGDELGVFQNMVQLKRDGRWMELLSVAEEQVEKTPKWLTPYLFSGIANAKLGFRSAAIHRLKFVQQEADGDPNYAEADRVLHQIVH
jgi:hypothetical protein